MKVGAFNGPVKAVWLKDDLRDMRIISPLHYSDSNGRIWTAPIGSRVNGASIPRVFWWLIGSPFVGKYRRASVIHDVYCTTHTRSAQDVHKVFYEMMRADGVSRLKAWVMFQAVDKFGPRW